MQCCVSSRVRRQEEDEQYRKKSEANKRKQLQAYDDMLRRMGKQEDDEMHAAARSHLKSIHREQVEQDLDLAVDQRMATRPEPRRLSQHEQEKADARALPKKHLKRELARRGLATAGPRDVLLKRLVVAINQAHVAQEKGAEGAVGVASDKRQVTHGRGTDRFTIDAGERVSARA